MTRTISPTMIIRQLCRRQARAIFGSSRPAVQRRFLSDEPPIRTATATAETPADVDISGDALSAAEQRLTQQWTQEQSQPESLTAREQWDIAQQRRKRFNQTGTKVRTPYHPVNLIRNPPKPSDVTLELLLASQAHLGHATSLWNPGNSSYIYGIRMGVHVISLEVTAAHLRRAAKVVEEVARKGGLILFVGTRKGQKPIVVRAAELAKGYFVFERWVPGCLTNSQQILGHCDVKVVDALDKEVPESSKSMPNDRPALKPDLVICLNPLENEPLLHECGLATVPTIGIIDTDADATKVTYPIPANDDSLRCVSVIAGVLGRAAEAGQAKRLEQSRGGDVPYSPVTEQEIKGPLGDFSS